MASDDLTGNIATETVIAYLNEQNVVTGINAEALVKSMQLANKVFYP
jgi:hydroxymethylglutaryl-CoA lyase